MLTLFVAIKVLSVQYRTEYIVLDIKKRPSYEGRFLISKFSILGAELLAPLFLACHFS